MVISTLTLTGAGYALNAALDANSVGNETKKLKIPALSRARKVLNLAYAVGSYFYQTKTPENSVKLAVEVVNTAVDNPDYNLPPELGIQSMLIEARRVLPQMPSIFEEYTAEMRLENTDPQLAKVQAAAQHVVQAMQQEQEPKGLMYYALMGLAHMENNK